MIKLAQMTWGGFIPSNMIKSVLKDAFESGDPVNYFRAFSESVAWIDNQTEDIDQDEWPELFEDLLNEIE